MSAISPTYWELIEKYKKSPHHSKGQLLHFDGIGDKDIYNATVIEDHGKLYIAARVESRDSDWMVPEKYDAQVMFFEKQQYGPWIPVTNAPLFAPMEDPFSAWIHDDDGSRKLVFGGVILDRSTQPPTVATVFYKGDNIFTLEKEPFAKIPMMKDIRLVERIHKKEIIICTRPQIVGNNTGRIGVIKINKLSQLKEDNIWDACIDFNQVAQGSWIGSNKLYLIEQKNSKKEQIGVLGHVATVDENGGQHYAAMTFTFDADDPCDQDYPEAIPQILATREDFEAGPAKTDILHDVVFPASLEHTQDGMVKLYAGLSDSRLGCILVPDPFRHMR